MSQFDIKGGVLRKYSGPGGNVAVPSGVTALGDWVFYDNQTVKSVILPDGLLEIGKNAFNCCNNLERVRLPGSLRVIGEDAFQICPSLSVCAVFDGTPPPDGCISLPDGLHTLEEDAFCHCLKLKTLTIPGSLREIADCAFSLCISLERVTILPGVEKIRRLAFGSCAALADIFIPESVIEIDDEMLERLPSDPNSEIEKLMSKTEPFLPPGMVRINTDMPRPQGLRIIGARGSCAERWAKAHGIDFYIA